MDIREFPVSEPRYTTKEVCAATGVKYDTFKTWIVRDLILGGIEKDAREEWKSHELPVVEAEADARENKAKGVERRLCLSQAMQVAIMAHFVDLGLPASKASRIALSFTVLGEGGAAWGDDPIVIKRRPGRPYDKGYTMLAAYADEEFGHVFNIQHNDQSFYEKLFYPPGVKPGLRRVAGVMRVDELFFRLINALEVKAHRVPEGE
ncbi:hypothetical protein HLH26_04710 [Gluconacetobacter sp. 1b LMG 1731]|uniref:Uncharacterized protein n=1 Tax=Gluconacetobacter dulcium TaxID=2729096 RepID=A0A7W4NUY4_9PROT|nr:hypothetical protein [Gluconacetobacter dulcium]MBB2163845.1 hypothetical protein [Gluconacetobacter dulcium]MBB2193171.1 hypothetical protein [Gluconacetobacter dulcium]